MTFDMVRSPFTAHYIRQYDCTVQNSYSFIYLNLNLYNKNNNETNSVTRNDKKSSIVQYEFALINLNLLNEITLTELPLPIFIGATS